MNNKETCPWCNQSMEPGTLCSRGGTFFLPDGESLPGLYTKSSMEKKRAVLLGQHSPVLGQIAPAQAYVCKTAKKCSLHSTPINSVRGEPVGSPLCVGNTSAIL